MHVRVQQGLQILADILCDELSGTGERMLTPIPAEPRGGSRTGIRSPRTPRKDAVPLEPAAVLARLEKAGR
jgi:hypothetical protein